MTRDEREDRQVAKILRLIDVYILDGDDAPLLHAMLESRTTKTVLWYLVWRLADRIRKDKQTAGR